MKTLSIFRYFALSVCALMATSAEAQNLPAIPPSKDPSFWGHPNRPYVLKETLTSTSSGGDTHPPTHTSEEHISRDSAGRVRVEDFYDSGQPWTVSIRDPNKNTFTSMQLVTKHAVVLSVPRPTVPPPGTGWSVERLPPRVIAGFPSDGFRFTRTIPASVDGQRAADRVIEEDWISDELSIVLEQRVTSQHAGTSITTVLSVRQVEPDPGLFSIPASFILEQSPAAAKN